MRFSIIIPVYNSAKTLEKCLNSVLAQKFIDWQAIVINDGSIDNSISIIKKYAELDKRISLIDQENIGPGLTRNKGIKLAEGDYIICLDSDDYVDTDFLEEINFQSKKENEDVDVIFLDLLYEKLNGDIIRVDTISKYKDYTKAEFASCQMTGKIPWGGCRKVVNKTFLLNNNIGFSANQVGEEAIYSFRLVELSKSVAFLDKALYHYVDMPTSQSKKGNDDPWGGIVEAMQNYLISNNVYAKYEKALNSFGVTALCVSANRIANNYSFSEAKRKIKQSIDSYKFSYDINRFYIENKVNLLYRLLKIRAVSVVIFLSKIKRMLRR